MSSLEQLLQTCSIQLEQDSWQDFSLVQLHTLFETRKPWLVASKAYFNSLNRRKANTCSSSLLLHIVHQFVCCKACLAIVV